MLQIVRGRLPPHDRDVRVDWSIISNAARLAQEFGLRRSTRSTWLPPWPVRNLSWSPPSN